MRFVSLKAILVNRKRFSSLEDNSYPSNTTYRYLEPHILRITIWFLQLDALVEAHGVARSVPHQMGPIVVAVAKEVVVGDESV